jgi:tetratricopeptide (TPR) repeat protein
MRHYAWVELQRGVLNLKSRVYEKARAHYQVADLAYSGYWLADEHIAELLGAQGKFDEAVAAYEKVIARVPRPEFQQALGELYLSMGQPGPAELWNQKALTAYLESAQSGGVHYYHHLTDFYADVREDGAEGGASALDVMRCETLHTGGSGVSSVSHGRVCGALDAMNESLSSGATDAQLFLPA